MRFSPAKIYFLCVFCFFVNTCLYAENSTNLNSAVPTIRVLVSEGQKSLLVTIKGAYVIKALPSLQVIKRGEHLIGVPLGTTLRGVRFAGNEYLVNGIRLEPADDRDLYLNKSRFRGFVDISKNTQGLLFAVNQLGIESYLYGVLHHEVAPWWPMDALKAQAIAARTYAYYQIQMNKNMPYDLKSGTSSQVYGGSTTERYRAKRAVDQTAGKILSYQGKAFPAFFHATCAGMTAGASELWNIDIEPLAGKVKCPYCRISPHYSWQAKMPLSDIEESMNKNGRPVGQILKIDPVTQTPSGRVGSLRITGTAQDTVMAAKDFRVWIGGDKLRSTWFTVVINDDVVEFRGKGWGHGVGLCQWGTLGQSLLGRSYEKILELYYPGSKIVSYENKRF